MPTILREGRYRFFFFSNEGFEPRHIHVEARDGYAKFWLEPIELASSVGCNAGELHEIRRIVIKNAKFFEEKWDAYFGIEID
jgi:hypothetical protein